MDRKKSDLALEALKACVAVMENDLNGLGFIQPELKQAKQAIDQYELVDAEFVEWDGEGLPPAGTLCEIRNAAGCYQWERATVVFASRNVVVWDWDGEPAINGLCTAYRDAVEIRPIRTPEQIAAEEREKAIAEICATLGWRNIRSDGSAQDAAALYDAGYRKQVAP